MNEDLKILKNYLGTGLKMIFEKSGRIINLKGIKELEDALCFFDNESNLYYQHAFNFKPLLLPLSALTEPMEDWKIPIVELAKISDLGFHKFIKLKGSEKIIGVKYFDNKGDECVFAFQPESYCFGTHYEQEKEFTLTLNQLQLFEWLFEHHFDVYNWIEAGKAIDKRTLNLKK